RGWMRRPADAAWPLIGQSQRAPLATAGLFDSAAALASLDRDAKTPARSKATGGGPFAKSDFALGTRRAELILGLPARLPMPRGRQLGTSRWCHCVQTSR